MRVEPYGVGSVLHVVKRGARGAEIVRDNSDRDRFMRLLFYVNDEYQHRSENGWEYDMRELHDFERPKHWPNRIPLARILAWTLMPNHFHIILEEVREGGISKFMQRLGGSMSLHFNAKYTEKGSLFQGSFRGRTIDTDEYLRYCAAYVMVKNTFELAPGGIARAAEYFDEAWDWSMSYPYSSLPVFGANITSPIIELENNLLKNIFTDPHSFKEAARDMLLAHVEHKSQDFDAILLEDW